MKYNSAFPYFPKEDIERILSEFKNILAGEGMLTKGPQVKEFEKEFAAYTGVRHAVAANSCTSALEVVLRAYGIGTGDEVIVPVQTFFSSASSAVMVGARPIFCDTDDNFLLSFEDLKAKITAATKAVVMVHFAGLIHPEIFAIRDYLKERNILLIEDAAHASGAEINGVRAGAIGDAGCFSFFSTKVITTGDGGMITTNNEAVAKLCRSLIHLGIDVDAPLEQYSEIGGNRRMTEFQGILGRFQLKRLDEFVAHRNMIARIYQEELRSFEKEGRITFSQFPDAVRHSYWRFIVFLQSGVNRDKVRERMKEKDIVIDWPYQPLIHLQPAFQRMYGTKAGQYLNAESRAQRHICLPIHLGISKDAARFIAGQFKDAIL
ncbi:DegT/DnrJ/EryC1/StrS family aminotransferase [Candidatus Uhrbacteria bacterium]|nr:DegT/DnrJ/EryC1/StrS family aminotransferase [Candidatus Uhrbacteria bacterium]